MKMKLPKIRIGISKLIPIPIPKIENPNLSQAQVIYFNNNI